MVEVAIAVMVLLVIIAGTLEFNKYSVLDVYRSRTKTDACMLGTMLMEAWRGQGGTTDFDPVNNLSAAILDCEDIAIGYAWVGPSIPPGFYHSWKTFPYYVILANNVVYRISFSFDYIDGRKFLNVRVGWPDSLDKTYWQSNNYVGITESLN